jgi:hypothetical protein
VLVAVLAVSVAAGAVWALLAPTERVFVNAPGVGSALTGESAHRFDAVAIFVCVGAVTGLLTAAATWRLRPVRGAILQVGLLLGSLVGAQLMVWFGEHVARWLHPHSSNPPLHTIVTLAPTVEAGPLVTVGDDAYLHAGTALAVQPLVASLVLLVLSALSTSEDLGTGLGRRHAADAPGPATGHHTSDIGSGPSSPANGSGTAPPQVAFEQLGSIESANSEPAR